MKFIICEDNDKCLNDIVMITHRVMASHEYDYKIHKFKDLTKELENIIEDDSTQKVYILDIQLGNYSGLEIASKIREKDWKSIIIFVTAYNQYKDDVFYSRLLALDYISKFQFFKSRLEETLNKVLTIINKDNVLTFKYNYTTYRIDLNDIVYIEKLPLNKKCVIYTESGNEFEINSTLQDVLSKLNNDFYQTHQSCIINLLKIKEIDYIDNKITFINNAETYLLSNRNKKGLKEHVTIS